MKRIELNWEELEGVLRYSYNTSRGDEQVKWPTQIPVYRGADTEKILMAQGEMGTAYEGIQDTYSYKGPDTDWKVVPWLKLDEINRDKSVFSLNTTFKNETRMFFSESNYGRLRDVITGFAYQTMPDITAKQVETTLREEMIRLYQMKTPRMDPTDPRTFSDDPSTTTDFVQELNKLVVVATTSQLNHLQRMARLAVERQAGPHGLQKDQLQNTQTRNIGSQFDMNAYHLGSIRGPRVSPSAADAAVSQYGNKAS